ncbi:fatty acid--CoA ligase family protein [Brevibacillus humidisoli]|uniref:class I adenylate-forming enzyme family protein n=1 Tax=Brevibacillus humidisoli TaxID=2895522 RepID=UPI001E4E5C9B|nr:fatty acid--CoA ligase family protein [Brevibacillus humidisoli]UFJ42436.1 fatty acid--CoA ligase family protein [Brevibacillus humidisoli]
MSWIAKRLAEADPHQAALNDGIDALPYDQLAKRVASCRKSLIGAGMEDARTIGLVVDQSVSSIILLLSLLELRAPLLPLDPSLTPSERLRVGRLAGVDLWITPDASADEQQSAEASKQRSLCYSQIFDTLPGTLRQARFSNHLLLLTSGSSGPMKAARIPYSSLWRGAGKYQRWFHLTRHDRILSAVPFFHSFGLIGALLGSLAAGGTLYVCRHPSPRQIAEEVMRNRCTVLFAVPQQYEWLSQSQMIKAEQLDSLSLPICSGGPLKEETAKAFQAKYGRRILPLYGSTETGAIAAQHPLVMDGTGATGFLLPGVDVAVTDEGRLAVASDTLFAGYVGEKDCHRRTRYFVTGDIGAVQERRVYLVGRVSQFVNLAGRKVNLEEVREVLLRHSDVREAQVIGAADPLAGEKLIAYLETRRQLDLTELRHYLSQHLASYKIPQEFHYAEGLHRGWKTSVATDDEEGREAHVDS